MRKRIERKQKVALRRSAVHEARKLRKLRLDQAAELAGVGYASIWRAEHGEPIGVDLAEKICASLGLDLRETTATDAERRPADGISPEAWRHFAKQARIRIRAAIRQAHRAVAKDAERNCWYWPGMRTVRERIVVRQRMANGLEGEL